MGRKRHGGGGKEGEKWLVGSGRVQKFKGSGKRRINAEGAESAKFAGKKENPRLAFRKQAPSSCRRTFLATLHKPDSHFEATSGVASLTRGGSHNKFTGR
jgi:hypothetical protein